MTNDLRYLSICGIQVEFAAENYILSRGEFDVVYTKLIRLTCRSSMQAQREIKKASCMPC